MALDASIEKRIRLLIPDSEAIFGATGDQYLFSPEDVEALYLEGFENTKCAAGLAKITIGRSEAFVLKVVKNYETSTDGAKLMAQWVNAGQRLYNMGLDEIANEDASEGMFDVVFPEYNVLRHAEGVSHGSYRLGGGIF